MAFTLVVNRWKLKLCVGNSSVVKIYIIRPKPGPVANVSLNCIAKCYLKPVNLNIVVKTIQHEKNTMNIDKDKLQRKLVRKHIKKNVPRPSRIHRFACAFRRERKKLLSGRVIFLPQLTKKTKRLVVDSRRRRKRMAAANVCI